MQNKDNSTNEDEIDIKKILDFFYIKVLSFFVFFRKISKKYFTLLLFLLLLSFAYSIYKSSFSKKEYSSKAIVTTPSNSAFVFNNIIKHISKTIEKKNYDEVGRYIKNKRVIKSTIEIKTSKVSGFYKYVEELDKLKFQNKVQNSEVAFLDNLFVGKYTPFEIEIKLIDSKITAKELEESIESILSKSSYIKEASVLVKNSIERAISYIDNELLELSKFLNTTYSSKNLNYNDIDVSNNRYQQLLMHTYKLKMQKVYLQAKKEHVGFIKYVVPFNEVTEKTISNSFKATIISYFPLGILAWLILVVFIELLVVIIRFYKEGDVTK